MYKDKENGQLSIEKVESQHLPGYDTTPPPPCFSWILTLFLSCYIKSDLKTFYQVIFLLCRCLLCRFYCLPMFPTQFIGLKTWKCTSPITLYLSVSLRYGGRAVFSCWWTCWITEWLKYTEAPVVPWGTSFTAKPMMIIKSLWRIAVGFLRWSACCVRPLMWKSENWSQVRTSACFDMPFSVWVLL